MRILTLLPAGRVARVRRALGPSDELIAPGTVAGFVEAAEARTEDVVLVDPILLTKDEWMRVVGKAAGSGKDVVVYAALDSRTASRVLAAAKAGVGDVILADVDDDAAALRRRLAAFRRPAPPARILATLASRFEALPAVLQCATLPLFSEAPVRRWVVEFAEDAGLSRRTVDRWVHRVGLAGTGALLDVARLSRSWVPLVEDKLDGSVVAKLCGFEQRRMLWRHSRRLVGASPTQFGTTLTVDQFVSRLAAHACAN